MGSAPGKQDRKTTWNCPNKLEKGHLIHENPNSVETNKKICYKTQCSALMMSETVVVPCFASICSLHNAPFY